MAHHMPRHVLQAIAPLRHQLVEVQLYRAVADRSRGRLVGSALIPLIDLMTSANIGTCTLLFVGNACDVVCGLDNLPLPSMSWFDH